MAFQVIQGGNNPGFEAPLYGIELVQLAHNSQRALINPYQPHIDPLSASVINTAYADALGLVSPEEDVPSAADWHEFVSDTHSYAANLLLGSALGKEFRLLSSVLDRRPVRWERLTGIRPSPNYTKPTDSQAARDRRVKLLSTAAGGILDLTKISPPLKVSVTHPPTDARREAFVSYVLRGGGGFDAGERRLRAL